MKLAFEKWEGLGNDFVLIDAPGLGLDLDAHAVQRLCDRRYGVGAGGVLLVVGEGSARRMIVRNADGSRPEMCGNGLRCVAAHLFTPRSLQLIATDAGARVCEVRPLSADRFEVNVQMGTARRGEDLVALIDGREHRFLTMDMGNPHAVTFEAYDDRAVDVLGPAVAAIPPGGTNVELCRVEGGRIAVTVWERGVGRTLACGTGACAVAAAACDTGRARFGTRVRVALPGGELEVTVDEDSRDVQMRGPARRVFSGEVVIA